MNKLSPTEVLKYFKKKYPLFYWWGFLLIIIFIFIIFFMMIFDYLKELFFIVFFIIIGGYSMIYQRVIRLSLGFEFVFFGTVLCGVSYGALIGASVGFIGLLIGEVLSQRISPHTIISFIAIVIIGLLSPYIYSGDIYYTGIILVIFYNLMIFPMYYMIGSNPVKIFIFSSTHILFQWWMFKYIAETILAIML